MKLKRDKLDKVFSDLIRCRSNYTCESCGKHYPDKSTRGGLHCSHLFSRRNKSTRYTKENAFAHCFTCHQRLGENPVDFYLWAEKRLGSEVFEIIREKAHQTIKYTKKDLEDMYKHMREQLKIMEDQRARGETGYIDFESCQ